MEIKININGKEIPQYEIQNILHNLKHFYPENSKLSNEDFERLITFMLGSIPSVISLVNNQPLTNSNVCEDEEVSEEVLDEKDLEELDKEEDENENVLEEPFPWFTPPFRKFGFHNFLSNPNIQSFKDFAKKSDICERIISQGLAKQKIEYILKNVEPKIIIPYYAKESFKRLVRWDEPTFISNTFVKKS
ncbi:MAG: hypothetical protein WC346_04450 [Methanogenium sp.]|jgi:hypothetical protein